MNSHTTTITIKIYGIEPEKQNFFYSRKNLQKKMQEIPLFMCTHIHTR